MSKFGLIFELVIYDFYCTSKNRGFWHEDESNQYLLHFYKIERILVSDRTWIWTIFLRKRNGFDCFSKISTLASFNWSWLVYSDQTSSRQRKFCKWDRKVFGFCEHCVSFTSGRAGNKKCPGSSSLFEFHWYTGEQFWRSSRGTYVNLLWLSCRWMDFRNLSGFRVGKDVFYMEDK